MLGGHPEYLSEAAAAIVVCGYSGLVVRDYPRVRRLFVSEVSDYFAVHELATARGAPDLVHQTIDWASIRLASNVMDSSSGASGPAARQQSSRMMLAGRFVTEIFFRLASNVSIGSVRAMAAHTLSGGIQNLRMSGWSPNALIGQSLKKLAARRTRVPAVSIQWSSEGSSNSTEFTKRSPSVGRSIAWRPDPGCRAAISHGIWRIYETWVGEAAVMRGLRVGTWVTHQPISSGSAAGATTPSRRCCRSSSRRNRPYPPAGSRTASGYRRPGPPRAP